MKVTKKRRNESRITILGNHIRKYRRMKGLTISELANQMDVDYSQASRMELSTVKIHIYMIFAVAEPLRDYGHHIATRCEHSILPDIYLI
jgi:transcriptional regulator with XRE-family HTH domain